MSTGVLSQDDCDEINVEKTVRRKNETLLNIILERAEKAEQSDHSGGFRIALEQTGQQHIVNYLDWDGGKFFNEYLFIFPDYQFVRGLIVNVYMLVEQAYRSSMVIQINKYFSSISILASLEYSNIINKLYLIGQEHHQ